MSSLAVRTPEPASASPRPARTSIYLGMDVHKDSSTIAVLPALAKVRRDWTGCPTSCRRSRSGWTGSRATARSKRAMRPVGPGTCSIVRCASGDMRANDGRLVARAGQDRLVYREYHALLRYQLQRCENSTGRVGNSLSFRRSNPWCSGCRASGASRCTRRWCPRRHSWTDAVSHGRASSRAIWA